MKTKIYFCKTCGSATFHYDVKEFTAHTKLGADGKPVDVDCASVNSSYIECTECGETVYGNVDSKPDINQIAELREWTPSL